MAKILMTWELGEKLGHIDRLLVIAKELRSHGHEVIFSLKDLSLAYERITLDGFMMIQSPIKPSHLVSQFQFCNYSGILAFAGWDNPTCLAGLISGWLSMFALVKPDLIICDHSPTAILAARGTTIPVCAIGNSFEIPPCNDYFPSFDFWNKDNYQNCKNSDEYILANVNPILELLKIKPLDKLTDLFLSVKTIIVTLKEFSHYNNYPINTTFVNPTFVQNTGTTPVWPEGNNLKVFVYVTSKNTYFDKVLIALKDLGLIALVYDPLITPDRKNQLSTSNIHIETKPFNMNMILKEVDIVISNGNFGTVTETALAGKIQFMLATHMEQHMLVKRISDTGAGIAYNENNDIHLLLMTLMKDEKYSLAAKTLALKYKDIKHTKNQLIDIIENIINV
jgi:UDP:flavonoid glycosyltransferase YjiC (YdhE family)